MGIIIHGNLDIRMAHDVLQGFGIHTGKSHFRTEGMTHGVERHVLRQDRAELFGVLFSDAVENVLVVACHSGVARPGAEQEISIIINFDVVFSGAGQYTLECLSNVIPHADFTDTALGLGVIYIPAHLVLPEKLVVDGDNTRFHVHVIPCEAAKL